MRFLDFFKRKPVSPPQRFRPVYLHDMTRTQRVFTRVALANVARGVHPTPAVMNRSLRALGYKRNGRDNSLGGDQVKWLRALVGRKNDGVRRPGAYPLCDARCCVPGGWIAVVIE